MLVHREVHSKYAVGLATLHALVLPIASFGWLNSISRCVSDVCALGFMLIV